MASSDMILAEHRSTKNPEVKPQFGHTTSAAAQIRADPQKERVRLRENRVEERERETIEEGLGQCWGESGGWGGG